MRWPDRVSAVHSKTQAVDLQTILNWTSDQLSNIVTRENKRNRSNVCLEFHENEGRGRTVDYKFETKQRFL